MTAGGPVVRVVLGDLSLTGVPVLAERLLSWASSNVDARFDVVAVRGGPLRDRVAAVASSMTILEPDGLRSAGDAVGAALAVLDRPRWGDAVRQRTWRRTLGALPRPDVVLLHGAGAWRALPANDAPGSRLVLHLQELAVALDRSIPYADRLPLGRRLSALMVVTPRCGDLEGSVPSGRIHVVPGVVPPVHDGSGVLGAAGPSGTDRRPVMAGVGSPGWRKGTDRFIAVAHGLRRSMPEVRSVWVGGRPAGVDHLFVGADVPVEWIPPGGDPWAHLTDAEVLLVPSREDPLPLVALEAGQRGLAVVAGRGGGLEDLLGDDAGVVVEMTRLADVLGACRDLLGDPARRVQLGHELSRRVAAHHDVAVVGPRWWAAVSGD